jgi:hypothetical protein
MVTVERRVLLDNLDPKGFEDFVGSIYKKMGYRTNVVGRSRDGGVDIEAQRESAGGREKIIIQCKRQKDNVGRPVLQQLWGVLNSDHTYTQCAVVTNAGFTADAREFAIDKRLTLIDGTKIEELARQYGVELEGLGQRHTVGPVAQVISVAAKNNQGKAFEPPFWTRYSPHHEFPLSTATSIALHVLALVFLIVAGWWVASMIEKSKLEVDTIETAFAGGGGNRQGEGNAPGDRPPVSAGQENVDTPQLNELSKPAGEIKPLDPLKNKIADPLDVILKDPNGRAINEANEAVQSLKKLSTDARSKLLNSIGPGKGKGGSGSGGGKDSGKDTGEGAFTGPGKSKFSSRQQRVLRWVMRFNTLNGSDYRRQLAGLGAILAFPQPDGSYMVYRDLRAPAKGEIEDIATIKRIFWVDDKKESIRSLASAMEVPVPDGPIVAFFPEKLEAELLRKELAYRGKKEEDIKETHFKINIRGKEFVPEVVEQY